MIAMVQYEYIRFLHINKGRSIRSIAREMRLHRKTVKKAIENQEHRYILTVDKPKPVNGPFEDRIKTMVTENKTRKGKYKLTKKRMFQLARQEGYTGKYSAFTREVRQIEGELGSRFDEAFLKLVPINGSLQVDFGTMTVMDRGMPRKIYAFCSKLCRAKAEFVKTYPGESTEFFFDGLVSAFEFYGGVPTLIIFDNLTPAVDEVLEGEERKLQPDFLKFKAFYCFDAAFCGKAKGNEKGTVENLVKYTRNNYFLPFPQFKDFSTFNGWLREECLKRNDEGVLEGKTYTQRIDEERFLPFTGSYDYGKIFNAKVDSYQLVHVDKNRYSVPTPYVNKKVTVRKYPFTIVISYNGEIIATHDRLWGKDKEHLNPYHYLDLLRYKARAYDQAKVIHDWKLPDIFEIYRRRLQAHVKSKSKGTREFIDILKLTNHYGIEEIELILKELDEKNRYGYQEVLSVLRCRKEESRSGCMLPDDILKSFNIDGIRSSHLTLGAYNEILEELRCAV